MSVSLCSVLDGIDAAAAAGLKPIKVNMVVRRGMNEQDIVPMARYFRERGHILRFIEYMDVGHTNGWRLDDVVPAEEIVAAIDAEMPLVAFPPTYPGEVADRWAYRDGSGEVGVIASVTQPFCTRLFARPTYRRRPAVYMPVRQRRPRPAWPGPRWRIRRRAARADQWRVGRPH